MSVTVVSQGEIESSGCRSLWGREIWCFVVFPFWLWGVLVGGMCLRYFLIGCGVFMSCLLGVSVLFRMVAGRSWHSFIVIIPQCLINLSGRDKLDWFDR